MVRRGAIILLEIVIGLIALVVVISGVLVWRVSQGPVSLDAITPLLERELSAWQPDVDVALGETVIAWEGWPETFALRLRDVRLSDASGQIARVPATDLRLSVPALINGTVAPTQFVIRGARLTVIRDADGLRFGEMGRTAGAGDAAAAQHPAAPPAETERDISRVLPDLLDNLMATATPERPLAYLEDVRIVDAAVTVADRRLDTFWRAPSASVTLQKTPNGLHGHAVLDLALGERTTRTTGAVSYRAGEDAVTAALGFEDLRPAALAAQIPALTEAAGIEIPLSGHAVARLGLDGRVASASAVLNGRDGEIQWPRYVPDPRPVRDLRLALGFDRAARTLEAREIRLAFGTADAPGPVIEGRARAARAEDSADIAVTGQTRVTDLDANELADYWPPGIQEDGNARGWITGNVRDGRVTEATVDVALTLPGGDPAAVTLDTLDGRMTYEGLSVRYLEEMPPVTGIGGTATFDATRFQFNPTQGRLDEVAVREADIEVTGLHLGEQFIAIDLRTDGPLRATLRPLAHPRLALLGDLGLSPEQVGGQARVQAGFSFPLREDLTVDGIEVQAQADLEQVRVDNFLLGEDVREGNLDVQIDKRGMTLAGPLSLARVPLSMRWRETFEASREPMREIEARVPKLTAADRERLGFATAPYLTGPISLALTLRGDADGSGRLLGAANLADAALAVDALQWSKAAGTPGQARFDLRLRDETPRRLESFAITAGPDDTPVMQAKGNLDLADDGAGVERVALDTLVWNDSALNGVTATRQGEAWRVEVAGGHLDAEPYLAELEGEAAETADAGADTGSMPALDVRTGRLDYVRLGPKRRLTDVRLKVRRTADGFWPEIRLRATVPERFLRPDEREDAARGPPVSIDFAQQDDGRGKLLAVAANAGALFRVFDLTGSIVGGHLTVRGDSRTADPGSAIDARVEMQRFEVRDAPIFARLLSVALLSGIADVMQGRGLTFQRLRGDVVLDSERVETDLLHAYGPAIGITAKGSVDFGKNKIDLDGTIVPAALVNRILGSIPLLGTLITGGEGEGLIAVTYRVEGPVADPELSVNPLSALAPGFLRGLFGGADDGTDNGAPKAALPPGAMEQNRR